MTKITLDDLNKIDISIEKKSNTGATANATKVTKPVKDKQGRSYATGKRKSSIARVWVKKGKGGIKVNNKTLDEYFINPSLRNIVLSPLIQTNLLDVMEVFCTVKGGGISGQAGSVAHGIAKALNNFSPELRSVLKSAKMLTRDSRVVERKKYGQHKARKKTQFSKR